MAFWVYLLRCADGKYYTGHTDSLEHRLAQHQSGGFCAFTSKRRPVALVWQQEMQTRDDAFRAEFRIKNWSRGKKEALIAGDWKLLSYLARPPRERVSTDDRGSAVHPEPAEGLDTSGVGAWVR
jgi:predicted GIY-YIG superfamily endonuclease